MSKDYELYPILKTINNDTCSIDPLHESVRLRSNDFWEEITPLRYRFQWGIGVVSSLKQQTNVWVDGIYSQVQQISSSQAIPKSMGSDTGKKVRAHLYYILLNLINHHIRDLEEPLMHSYQDGFFSLKYINRTKIKVSTDRINTLLSKLKELGYVTAYKGGVLKYKTDEIEEFAVMLNGVYPTEKLWNTTKDANGEHFVNQSSFTFDTKSDPVIVRLVKRKKQFNEKTQKEETIKYYQRLGINDLSVPNRTELKDLSKPVPIVRNALVNHNYSYSMWDKDKQQFTGEIKHIPGYQLSGLVRILNSRDLRKGGRYYRGFWQYIHQIERKTIKIDGMDTIEEDWSASQWNILYIWKTRKKYPGDIYTLEDHSLFYDAPAMELARTLMKRITLPLLGSGDLEKSLKAANYDHILGWKKGTAIVKNIMGYGPEETVLKGDLLYHILLDWKSEREQAEFNELAKLATSLRSKGYSNQEMNTMLKDVYEGTDQDTLHQKARELLEAFYEKHNAVLTGEAFAPELQRIESDLASELMLEFLERTDNSPILCVHDSFIVQESHHDLLKELMEKYSSEEVVKEYLKAN